jgi:hypothetical protein
MSMLIEARLVRDGFFSARLAIADRAVIDNPIEAYLEDGILSKNDEVILTWIDKRTKIRKSILYIDEDHVMVTGALDEATIRTRSDQPPPVAEFFLHLVARTKNQQAALGDLTETFNRNCAQHGRARATRLYWVEALRSLWPLFRRMIGRAVKWGVIVDAMKHHFFS